MDRPTSPPADRPAPQPFDCWESGGSSFFGIKVQPGAKRDRVLGLWNRRLRIAVRAPAEKGRANEAAIELLAEALGRKRASVEIVAGASSREKTLRVAGIDAVRLAELLRKCLP